MRLFHTNERGYFDSPEFPTKTKIYRSAGDVNADLSTIKNSVIDLLKSEMRRSVYQEIVFIAFIICQITGRWVRIIGAIDEVNRHPTTIGKKLKKAGMLQLNWIADEMSGKSCVVVLVGSNTAGRKWINHEIIKGWDDGKEL